MPTAWAGALDRLPAICFLYLLVELWRYWSFRRLLKRVGARRYAYQGGRNFIQWVKGVLASKKAPLTLDRLAFHRYTTEQQSPESCGYGGGALDWRRMYAWWAWGCGRPFDPLRDPEFHADLLECVSASCKALDIEAPPEGASAPATLAVAPFGYGCSEVRATFKPLPIRLTLRGIHMSTRLALMSLGFRKVEEPMPEGDLVCWSNLAGGYNASASHRRPVVFLHGLGLGAFTYLPLFLGKESEDWRAGGCIVVELPCMSSPWADLEGLPQATSYADALARVLRRLLGPAAEFGYDVVCHSLSAYLVAILCNEGSPCQPKRSVLIDPVCFLEGVEVCSRFPFRTPEECRVFAEATVLFPQFLPRFARRALGVAFRQLVCRDIFTQYSVLRWNGTDATAVVWRSESAEALVCLSGDDHFVPSARVATHCEGHFPKIRLFQMPGKDHGSFVIETDLRRKLMGRIALFLKTGE